VELGNALYPTPWRAKRFGMTQPEMEKTFCDGVSIDYTGVQERGDQVKKTLSAGNELHITNPNGTDLKLRLTGRPVTVSDGIISPEDIQKGGAAIQVWLPAGDVYFIPVAGTAEGKVVHSMDYFEGKEVQNLTLTFARGKVVSMTGSGPGFAELKSRYDAAADGKEAFSVVDIGINPGIKLPAASRIGTWVPAGSIAVGIGNNIWAGGDIKIGFGYVAFLTGSTVTLDDKTIIENGQLKI
jgi:leucyl aminopeptidase (aminopeptidase T)